MTHVADHAVIGAAKPPAACRRRPSTLRPASINCRDRRWPALVSALTAMREARRCSVRIIDADCGAGTMLVCAARHARALGFTAIEAHGIDDAPALVARARAAAALVSDPAIGLSFAVGDVAAGLEGEAEFPADIVICHDHRTGDAAIARAVTAAGRMLVTDAAAAQALAA